MHFSLALLATAGSALATAVANATEVASEPVFDSLTVAPQNTTSTLTQYVTTYVTVCSDGELSTVTSTVYVDCTSTVCKPVEEPVTTTTVVDCHVENETHICSTKTVIVDCEPTGDVCQLKDIELATPGVSAVVMPTAAPVYNETHPATSAAPGNATSTVSVFEGEAGQTSFSLVALLLSLGAFFA